MPHQPNTGLGRSPPARTGPSRHWTRHERAAAAAYGAPPLRQLGQQRHARELTMAVRERDSADMWTQIRSMNMRPNSV